MKKITINLSFYNQDNTLRKHVLRWNSWPKEILKYYSFCIIDDCSKNNAKDVLKGINLSEIDLSIYRVQKDLFCNIAGVRNLSAKICKTDWILILDMDTLISQKFASLILPLTKSPKGNCYKFNRKLNKNPFHKKNRTIHPAVCLIRVEDYWNVGGCEEDLVGHYGQTDPIFWYRAQGKLKIQTRKDIFLEYLPEGESNINRDTFHNKNLFEKKKIDNSWSTDFIRFEWEKIY
tara:strand:+ start:1270 stop:1968 length:699 start_codon:yes stop_codon:yes gene_type:complete